MTLNMRILPDQYHPLYELPRKSWGNPPSWFSVRFEFRTDERYNELSSVNAPAWVNPSAG
jgi:hypothetical protein